jgi:hypothetical protein
MILVLVLVMVVFFIFGYQVHKMQYQEKEKSLDSGIKEYRELFDYTQEKKIGIRKREKELEEQAAALQVNFNNRWKEVESRINENDVLKNQLFIMQKNCSCTGVKTNGK